MGNIFKRGSRAEESFGITPHEKKLITNTYKILHRDLTKFGVSVVTLFFRNNPQMIQFFYLKSRTADDIENDAQAKLLGLHQMYDIQKMINALGKEESLLFELRKFALKYKMMHFPSHLWEDYQDCLKTALKAQLGPQIYTPEVEAAWEKFLSKVVNIVVDIAEEKKCLCYHGGLLAKEEEGSSDDDDY